MTGKATGGRRDGTGGASEAAFTLDIVDSLATVGRSDWNAIANPAGAAARNPFVDWDFLEALEVSGCVSERTGWLPRHILLRDTQGRLVGAAPAYLKTHSRGEFVFDHAFADALHNAGGDYYPKLLCAVPFTPVTGPRLLCRPEDAAQVGPALAKGLLQAATAFGLSSAHVNFAPGDEWETLQAQGFLPRTDQQFHWLNDGYASFEDFLSALTSRKRKMIRRERTEAQAGLEIVRLSGADLRPEHWDAFYRFYTDTGGRKWGSPYLNRAFFDLLHQRQADDCLLVLALDGGRPIAGALNLIGGDTLYGRYWGRTVDRPFLHFEVCYYQAIDFAIERGLAKVEAGAQGEHKLARGYAPAITRSAHWFAHPGLHNAVSRYLERERSAVADSAEALQAFTPFRKAATSSPDDATDEGGF